MFFSYLFLLKINNIIPSSKNKSVRVEGKDKEKKEVLVKDKQTEYKKKEVAMVKEKRPKAQKGNCLPICPK